MYKKLKSYLIVGAQMITLLLIGVSGPIFPHNIFYLFIEIIGIILGIWSVWSMQLNNLNILPDVKKDSRLVTIGPYKYIRHPMYTSLLLITLILIINKLTLSRILLWVVLCFVILIKISYEEKLLSKHFSDYSEYKKTTKYLVPLIF